MRVRVIDNQPEGVEDRVMVAGAEVVVVREATVVAEVPPDGTNELVAVNDGEDPDAVVIGPHGRPQQDIAGGGGAGHQGAGQVRGCVGIRQRVEVAQAAIPGGIGAGSGGGGSE